MRRPVSLVILFAALGLVLATPTRSQDTVGDVLSIQPGARQAGMGAAGVALLGEPSDAVWWNPAALGFVSHPSCQITHAGLFPGVASDVNYWHGAATFPIRGIVNVGFGYTHLSLGDDQLTDQSGLLLGEFVTRGYSPCASAGIAVLPNLALGATAKWVHIQLPPSRLQGTASTFAFDGAALYRMTRDSLTLSLGANMQNLGSEVAFINEDQSTPLPRNLRLGAALQFHSHTGSEGSEVGGVVVIDHSQSLVTSDFETWNGGAELYGDVHDLVRLSLRGGYYDDSKHEIKGATIGVGLRVAGLSLDVGQIPPGRGLKRASTITVGYHFDQFPHIVNVKRKGQQTVR